MFRSIATLIFCLGTVMASGVTDAEKKAMGLIYLFDQDLLGKQCDAALESNDEEDFRLYCINSQESFRKCAMTCSEALKFEGSKGVCKSAHRCDFYSYAFDTPQGPLDMSDIAKDKVTFFTIGPLWEGHAQYMYEMLEEIREMYPYETEAIFLPVDIHDYESEHPRFELAPFQSELGNLNREKRVHILPEVKPHEIGSHKFFKFIRSLVHRDGFPSFDVYTDRPVVFAISHNGFRVERMVVPRLDDLKDVVSRLGPNRNSIKSEI